MESVMNKTSRGILILSIPIFLTMLMGADAATVQQDLSVTVVPSSSKQPGQCVYGNHGSLRGRPTVVPGKTIIADDGCELFGIASFTIPDGPFTPCYTSLTWWKQIHDQGHINVIRAFGYLGNWYDGSSNYTDLPTQEANLDTIVSL